MQRAKTQPVFNGRHAPALEFGRSNRVHEQILSVLITVLIVVQPVPQHQTDVIDRRNGATDDRRIGASLKR
jgi:hypothetical protein